MGKKPSINGKPFSKSAPAVSKSVPNKSALKSQPPAKTEKALSKKLKSTKLAPVVEELFEDDDLSESEDEEEGGVTLEEIDLTDDSESEEELDDESDEDDDEDADEEEAIEEEEEQEDIPLSDIESLDEEDRGDIIPHQRLTINNHAALEQALKSIALAMAKLPFSEHQCVVATETTDVPDVDDDLNRELAFYKQSLDAVKLARTKLKAEKLPFSRPTDFFAEMVKSDEHMGKVKAKLVDDATSKKAASEARKQRDLKKFGKQVQVAKQQERDKLKRETLEKIQMLKRKRQNTDIGDANEDDMFDVALDDATKPERRARTLTMSDKGNPKRQKKDSRFGHGGKKRFAKSGDAQSTGDMSGFSNRANKAPFGASRGGRGGRGGGMRGGARGGKFQRPGKSRRQKV